MTLQVSQRGSALDESPIRSLQPFANAAKARGTKVFHLNIGQPDLETPREALLAVQQLEEPIVAYGPSAGLPSLRARVAEYYQGFASGIHTEDVFVTTGASEAILYALMTVCDPEDEVIVPEPFYANYLGFASMAGVSIRPITTYLEEEFALPKAEAFEALIGPRSKAILLCNPGNPTGQLYGPEELAAILSLARRYGLFVVVDEVYRAFCYDQNFHSALAFPEYQQQVIVVDSISKVFSACGARIGYLVTKNEAIKATVEKYAQLRLCPPYYGQKLAEACYEIADEYMAASKEVYRGRRAVQYAALQQMPGVDCYFPQAAFYNICQLPVDDAEAFCRWLLSDFSYQDQTVMLAPATGFYANTELGRRQVRIAYMLEEQALQKAMECLALALEQYPGRV
ncbi:MAG: pyridoxal phosphate-dependent aminotransferase [Bacteroidota bacterium]